MTAQYFSEREYGAVPRTIDVLPDAAWGGLAAIFQSARDRGAFGNSFPDPCPDGGGVSGTNDHLLGLQLAAEIPGIGSYVDPRENPGTVTAMDVAEFAWRHVAETRAIEHHSFFSHDHLAFDVAAGRERWRDDVNIILRRNGLSVELAANGEAVRLGTPAAQAALAVPLPKTGDDHLDSKLGVAVAKYHDPDPTDRREALEALWDAFERVKTLLDPTKPAGTSKLIAAVSPEPDVQTLLQIEFKALTTIGNGFMIRHHETNKLPVEDSMVDYFFVRALNFMDVLIRSSF